MQSLEYLSSLVEESNLKQPDSLLSSIRTTPLTSSLEAGVVVPSPTLPFACTFITASPPPNVKPNEPAIVSLEFMVTTPDGLTENEAVPAPPDCNV